MFDALAARYTTPLRHDDYERARSTIAHNAFVPSNAWRDTAIWSARPSASVRQVHAFGTLTPGGYRFSSVPTVPGLRGIGDSRHGVTLVRLADGLYRWETLADYRLGGIAPERAAGVFPAMFAAAEGRSEQSVRGDYLGAFPRTSAALGRYANLDTIRPTRLPDGSTSVRAVITLHASHLAGTYPALAEYLAKYTSKSRMRVVMRDRGGVAPATWFVLDARKDRITIDARVRNGALVPFHGPPRPFPDAFEMVVDAVATVGPFTAGFETLRERVRGDLGADATKRADAAVRDALIQQILTGVDLRPLQVLIEVMIAETAPMGPRLGTIVAQAHVLQRLVQFVAADLVIALDLERGDRRTLPDHDDQRLAVLLQLDILEQAGAVQRPDRLTRAGIVQFVADRQREVGQDRADLETLQTLGVGLGYSTLGAFVERGTDVRDHYLRAYVKLAKPDQPACMAREGRYVSFAARTPALPASRWARAPAL